MLAVVVAIGGPVVNVFTANSTILQLFIELQAASLALTTTALLALEMINTAVVDHRVVTEFFKCKVVWLLVLLGTVIILNKLIDVYHIDFVIVQGKWENRDGRNKDLRSRATAIPWVIFDFVLVLLDRLIDYIDPFLGHEKVIRFENEAPLSIKKVLLLRRP